MSVEHIRLSIRKAPNDGTLHLEPDCEPGPIRRPREHDVHCRAHVDPSVGCCIFDCQYCIRGTYRPSESLAVVEHLAEAKSELMISCSASGVARAERRPSGKACSISGSSRAGGALSPCSAPLKNKGSITRTNVGRQLTDSCGPTIGAQNLHQSRQNDIANHSVLIRPPDDGTVVLRHQGSRTES